MHATSLSKKAKSKSYYSRNALTKRWVFLVLPWRVSIFLFRHLVNDNHERNTLEAPKFLELVVLRYGSKKYFTERYVKFPMILGSIPEPNISQLTQAVLLLRHSPELRAKVSEEINRSLVDLSYKEMSAHQWKLFSLALTGFGFVRAGTIARNYCLAAALDEADIGKASDRTLHIAVRGLIESRRFEDANNFIQRHGDRLGLLSVGELYCTYLSALNQELPKIATSNDEMMSDSARIARLLITDKNVSLVATGELTSPSGIEIDSFDTVARVKFQGHTTIPDPEFAGTRCDVTAFTQELVDKFFYLNSKKNNALEFLECVKLVFVKQRERVEFGSVKTLNMGPWAPTFLTTATSGTLFLFELLRHKPKSLKLFGFNFYTQRSIYNSKLMSHLNNPRSLREIGLPKNWFKLSSERKNSAIIASGFVNHDPRSDFLLVKNLYELSGLIDGTPEVLEILNLTADEYDARLEEMLGDW